MRIVAVLCALCALVAARVIAQAPARELKFIARVLDPHLGNVCYAVTLADVNGDGKSDMVAVSENAVVWYEAPSWRKRLIIENQTERDNVCIDAADLDGDGKVDFALGAGWTKVGTMQWLTRGASLDDKWSVHSLGKEAWTHRMRWGDVLGTKKPQLVVSPLNKTQGDGVRLLCLEVPANPRTDPWKTTVIDQSLDRMHNHWIADLDGDGRPDLLTASQEGLTLFRYKDGTWSKTKLANGSPPPARGCGEVKVGKFGGRKIIVTIETMHGKDVAVYFPEGASRFLPTVIEDGLAEGHAVVPADLDGDGNDEVIAGDRGKGGGVFAYRRGRDGRWAKFVIDNTTMLPEDLAAADLTGDGKVDLIAGGRATHNVVLYENVTGK